MKKNALNLFDIAFVIGTIVFVLVATWYAMSPDAQCAVLLVFMFGTMYMCTSDNFDKHLNKILDKIFQED